MSHLHVYLLLLAGLSFGALACGGGEETPPTTTTTATSGGAGGVGGEASSSGGTGGTGGQGGQGGQGGCSNSLPVLTEAPASLSATGLYEDISAKTLGQGVLEFSPRFKLWSDGTEKHRWIYLPECEVIDTSDMNNWSLPIGSRVFKDFVVDGAIIETRLFTRFGAGPYDFLFASYQWNEEQSEATLVGPDGVLNVNDTNHDIPSEDACRKCHGSHSTYGGRPSRALGFSALQLSHTEEGLTLDALIANERLSHPPAAAITVPGDAVAQQALGYLHANCGNCHNKTIDGITQVDLDLWLDIDHEKVEDTPTFLTAVDKPNQLFSDQNVTARIVPGDPSTSSISYRMGQRGNNAQMPPLGTELTDSDGQTIVNTWIEGLK